MPQVWNPKAGTPLSPRAFCSFPAFPWQPNKALMVSINGKGGGTESPPLARGGLWSLQAGLALSGDWGGNWQGAGEGETMGPCLY